MVNFRASRFRMESTFTVLLCGIFFPAEAQQYDSSAGSYPAYSGGSPPIPGVPNVVNKIPYLNRYAPAGVQSGINNAINSIVQGAKAKAKGKKDSMPLGSGAAVTPQNMPASQEYGQNIASPDPNPSATAVPAMPNSAPSAPVEYGNAYTGASAGQVAPAPSAPAYTGMGSPSSASTSSWAPNSDLHANQDNLKQRAMMSPLDMLKSSKSNAQRQASPSSNYSSSVANPSFSSGPGKAPVGSGAVGKAPANGMSSHGAPTYQASPASVSSGSSPSAPVNLVPFSSYTEWGVREGASSGVWNEKVAAPYNGAPANDRWGLSSNFPISMPPGGRDESDLFAMPGSHPISVYRREVGSLTDENYNGLSVGNFMKLHSGVGGGTRTRGSRFIAK